MLLKFFLVKLTAFPTNFVIDTFSLYIFTFVAIFVVEPVISIGNFP